MTRAMLRRYRKDLQLIRILEMRLKNMEAGKGSYEDDYANIVSDTILDYRTGKGKPVHITGFNRKLYDRTRTSLAVARERKRIVDEWITDIEDDLTRNVFELYYQDGKTWLEIAMIIKRGSYEEYPRIVIHDRYLKEQHIL